MILTRDNFSELLTPVHRNIFYMSYLELAAQYPQIFSVENMRGATESFVHMGSMGLWDENNEGNTINEDSFGQGDDVTFEAVRYDKGYEVTWELIQDNYYSVMTGFGKSGKGAKELGRGLRATVETKCANVLNDGFANTGYDAVSLFSNSHQLVNSSSTSDNLSTGILTDTSYKNAAIVLKDQRDEANLKIGTSIKNLIVPDELEYVAKQIMQSERIAGEMSNTDNTAPKAQVIVMQYLTSTTAWFIQANVIKNLVLAWREKPWFGVQEIQKKIDAFMFGYARWDQGYVDWRGLVGSTGL